jgi:hypothetical protein
MMPLATRTERQTRTDTSEKMINKKRPTVRVTATDYAYDGWLVSIFRKRRGDVRYVVEDDCGRLFIHNAKQLGVEEGWGLDNGEEPDNEQ